MLNPSKTSNHGWIEARRSIKSNHATRGSKPKRYMRKRFRRVTYRMLAGRRKTGAKPEEAPHQKSALAQIESVTAEWTIISLEKLKERNRRQEAGRGLVSVEGCVGTLVPARYKRELEEENTQRRKECLLIGLRKKNAQEQESPRKAGKKEDDNV